MKEIGELLRLHSVSAAESRCPRMNVSLAPYNSDNDKLESEGHCNVRTEAAHNAIRLGGFTDWEENIKPKAEKKNTPFSSNLKRRIRKQTAWQDKSIFLL